MISVLFGLFVIYSLANRQALASLTTCLVPTSSSIRYNIILSSIPLGSYSGTLLLSPDSNFVSIFTIPDTGSPQSVIQGTWSLSDYTKSFTFTAQTLYFMDLPKLSIKNLTCTYKCGTNDNSFKSCMVTYTLKSLKKSGTYPLGLDLSIPE